MMRAHGRGFCRAIGAGILADRRPDDGGCGIGRDPVPAEFTLARFG
jgi:hypothetical protein